MMYTSKHPSGMYTYGQRCIHERDSFNFITSCQDNELWNFPIQRNHWLCFKISLVTRHLCHRKVLWNKPLCYIRCRYDIDSRDLCPLSSKYKGFIPFKRQRWLFKNLGKTWSNKLNTIYWPIWFVCTMAI